MSQTLYLPTTEHASFYSLMAFITSNPNVLKTGLKPTSNICISTRKQNYATFRDNNFLYTFCFELDLDDVLTKTLNSISNANIIAHDQIRLNFNTPLLKSRNEIRTIRDCISMTNRYSQQYGQPSQMGINLSQYAIAVNQAVKTILDFCPTNIATIGFEQPFYYKATYNFIDLLGNSSLKTSLVCIEKFINQNGKTKIFLSGTGYLTVEVGGNNDIIIDDGDDGRLTG